MFKIKIQRNSGPARRVWAIPVVAIVAILAMVAGPQVALAQQGLSPTQDQYDPSRDQIEQQVGGGSAPPSDGDSADRVISGLPFTGLDIGLLGAVAVLLTASGLALRRFAAGGASR